MKIRLNNLEFLKFLIYICNFENNMKLEFIFSIGHLVNRQY
ncbi:hypothetical protein HMPREF0379_2112 [[Eubacterium] yurii subsp. margaretiae ATCC 43715]|nr:hypothetical protein HMPREF0379_2112 [[Eubacterium] yurii subsp. margaretiae ATCC 43715]